jgi:hypothetical protein
VRREIAVVITTVAAALIGTGAGECADARSGDAKSALSAHAQARTGSTRPRTRIRVTPAYPYRTFSTDYPVPYRYEYPGPGFVRQCSSWLAPENRPSGPVIVPRMRCWWQPG